MLPQVGIQYAAMQAAKGDDIAADLPVQGAEAHQVNRGLEDCHPIQGWITGQPEGHILVASGDVPFETSTVQVKSSSFAGEFGFSAAVSANKNAVVMLCVLVQQASLDKALDYLSGDTALAQVGKYPALVLVGRR